MLLILQGINEQMKIMTQNSKESADLIKCKVLNNTNTPKDAEMHKK